MTASLPRPEPISVSTGGLVGAELAKLRGSLVVPLSLATPAIVLVFSLLATLVEDAAAAEMFLLALAGMWSYAMLPLGVVALTVVLAQLEHGPRGWDPLLAMPGARRRIFLIKLAAAFIVVGIWHAIMFAGGALVAHVFAALDPQLEGAPATIGLYGETLARMWGASFLMVTLQYGIALYFRSFVPPLLIGLAGIFVSVVAMASKYGAWFPWLLATNQLASDQHTADLTLLLGFVGGVVGAVVLQVLMARREW